MEKGFAKLLMIVFVWGAAIYALKTEVLIMKGRYKKSENPFIFWLGVTFYFGVGLYVIVQDFFNKH
ncbi:MAG: hypothetical protein HQK76_19890 [Desulfobacterales bacterium]|nr:hypothetical protein [Desulfobacterales bacterium]